MAHMLKVKKKWKNTQIGPSKIKFNEKFKKRKILSVCLEKQIILKALKAMGVCRDQYRFRYFQFALCWRLANLRGKPKPTAF